MNEDLEFLKPRSEGELSEHIMRKVDSSNEYMTVSFSLPVAEWLKIGKCLRSRAQRARKTRR